MSKHMSPERHTLYVARRASGKEATMERKRARQNKREER